MFRLAFTTILGDAVFRLRVTRTIFGVVMDMIAASLPVIVSAALVETAAMREDRPCEKHHQNENPDLCFH